MQTAPGRFAEAVARVADGAADALGVASAGDCAATAEAPAAMAVLMAAEGRV